MQPIAIFYRGTGMTSQHTVSIFFRLDAMFVAAIYKLLAAVLWRLYSGRLAPAQFWRYYLPVAAIHSGVVLALLGALSASILDSYAQKTLHYPDVFGKTQRFADDYALQIQIDREGFIADGARNNSGFHAAGTVKLFQQYDSVTRPPGTGNTLFRDERAPLSGSKGSVRQLCEILDYRYARFNSGPGYRLDPFILRGFWRDVQVWVPAIEYSQQDQDSLQRKKSTISVVIKTYPLMSWLWSGLLIVLLGAGLRTVFCLISKKQ